MTRKQRRQTKGRYRAQAEKQGLLYPFQILSAMDTGSRMEIAKNLGVRFASPMRAPAQAWTILSKNRHGLQAQSLRTYEVLSPFSRNITWDEILNRTAKAMKIRVPAKSTSEAVEKMIVAGYEKEVVAGFDKDIKKELEKMEQEAPRFVARVLDAGLSRKTVKIMLSGARRAALNGKFATFKKSVQTAAWLNKNAGTKIMMKTAPLVLKRVMASLSVFLWAWTAYEIAGWIVGPNYRKVATAIYMMHLSSRLQGTIPRPGSNDRKPGTKPVRHLVYVHGFLGSDSSDLDDPLRIHCENAGIQFHRFSWEAGTGKSMTAEITGNLLEAAGELDWKRMAVSLGRPLGTAHQKWNEASLSKVPLVAIKFADNILPLLAGGTVSLVGFSLGASIVLKGIKRMTTDDRKKIHRVVFTGAAFSTRETPPSPSPPLVNLWSREDFILGLLYSVGAGEKAAGYKGWKKRGVRNIKIKSGHLSYGKLAEQIVKIAFPSS